MVPNPTLATLVTLFFGVSILIFMVFLPSLLEIKKPKDAGPRMILRNVPIALKLPIPNLEEDIGFDQIVVKQIAKAISVLPDLEA